MIDHKTETLIPLSEAARLAGVCRQQVYVWVHRPVQPLEAVRRRGRIYTSVEALQRFDEPEPLEKAPALVCGKARQKAHDAAKARLQAAGWCD